MEAKTNTIRFDNFKYVPCPKPHLTLPYLALLDEWGRMCKDERLRVQLTEGSFSLTVVLWCWRRSASTFIITRGIKMRAMFRIRNSRPSWCWSCLWRGIILIAR